MIALNLREAIGNKDEKKVIEMLETADKGHTTATIKKAYDSLTDYLGKDVGDKVWKAYFAKKVDDFESTESYWNF
mgnify:CR=1 FL=1|jgi:hypothetical protein